jgi:hypothetical protein
VKKLILEIPTQNPSKFEIDWSSIMAHLFQQTEDCGVDFPTSQELINYISKQRIMAHS